MWSETFLNCGKKVTEHHCNYFDVLDDALMLRLNGPRTVEEFAEGSTTADLEVALTPFSRECASLWRLFSALALAITMRRPQRLRGWQGSGNLGSLLARFAAF